MRHSPGLHSCRLAITFAGSHFLLWDNYWNTNYVFWWPYDTRLGENHDNIRFRFAIELLPGV